ncbi:MAG: type II toxin-antitoxin system death-on-curing family toxin [Candidatus Nomurabacteria bacterium]
MNEDGIYYPKKSVIELWVKMLRSENPILNIRLPITDEKWLEEIVNTIERIKINYIAGIHSKAGHLLFYLDKNHNFLDGNKRTTIIVVYLFYFINGFEVTSGNRFRDLVKKVARSHGSRNKDDWMNKIKKELSYITKKSNYDNL